ncbi:hypothetical protein FRC17_007775 [Serendipita sp. 399]|nr:hypothetical protein FRC17_007775 [Serendipita sp. 399]
MNATSKGQTAEREDTQTLGTPNGAVFRVSAVPSNVGSTIAKDRINGLPIELLVSIFELDVESQHVRRNATLMLVCKRWREVADSSPRLWSQIRLAPRSNINSLILCTDLVKFCIKKSQEMPLDITLDFTSLRDPAARSLDIPNGVYEPTWDPVERTRGSLRLQLKELVDALYVSPMARWRHFRLRFSSWMSEDLASSILAQFCAAAPMLETLDISRGNPWEKISAPSEKIEDAIYCCPLLSSPKLTKFTTRFAIDPSRLLSGRHLMRSIGFAVTPTSFNCLPYYQGIRTLHLFADNLSIEAQGQLKSGIILPHLSTLILGGMQGGVFLSLIDAPGLHCLRLSGTSALWCPESELFGHIRRLEWDFYFYDYEADKTRNILRHIFRQCDQLVHFTTWGPYNSKASYTIMNFMQEILTEYPLRSLTSITYLRPYVAEFDSAPIQSVVAMAFV